jgi:HEAT repeat protein
MGAGMAARSQRSSFDAQLAALREVRADPHSESAGRELRRALSDPSWLVVSEAAKIIGEHELEGFTAELIAVWPRLAEQGKKRDPGCRAKLAALTALDRTGLVDPDPFLEAIRYVQLEPVAGGTVDTATGVRLRALCALWRLLHPDGPLFAGELMADQDSGLRAGVARAIGDYGDRASASLLVYQLRAGDEDPVVLSDCAASLLLLAPDFAVKLLASLLERGDEVRREAAALALGQSKDPAVVSLLIEWLADVAYDRDFELGVRALGLSRSEPARRFLLGLVEQGSPQRARRAVEALAVHSYDQELLGRVRRAAAANARAKLGGLVDRLFQTAG